MIENEKQFSVLTTFRNAIQLKKVVSSINIYIEN